jgi:hypothetical protein
MGISRSFEDEIIKDCEEFKKFHPTLECGYLVD